MAEPLFEITVRHEGAELARYPLAPGEYTIGRSSSSSIPIQVGPVSRQHARVLVSARGAVQVEDLASANGTLLDGQPIAGLSDWRPGQILRIGDAALQLATTALDAAGIVRQHLPLVTRQSQDYAIGTEVARGGMGAVLQARESATRRTVAMKVMLGRSDAKSTLRFIEEAQITAQLEHPNIVPVHDLGIDDRGQPYYTMKLVAGITLKKVLDLLRQRLPETVRKYPLGTLLTAFQKIGDALAFAHSRGVIHRDLKPANIMLGKYGEVLVMDWGLAKIIGTGREPKEARTLDPEHTVIGARREQSDVFSTRSGAVMGTANYMNPEQARGEVDTLDARSDVFALGLILYEIVTLERPFMRASGDETIAALIEGKYLPPTDCVQRMPGAARPAHLPGGEVPASLAAIIRQALAHDRAARYPNVTALQADLTAYQNGFATGAEKAGLGRQILLGLKRHKAVATSIAAALLILAAVTAGFTLKVIGERNRAEAALVSLRAAAPTLAAQAHTLVGEQKLDEAVAKLNFALTIDPQNPEYLLQQANYLQAAARLDEAIPSYRKRLAIREDAAARENLALCEKLAPRATQPETLRELFRALSKQGRNLEATTLARRTGLGSESADALIREVLSPLEKLPEWKKYPASGFQNPGGMFTLVLHSLPITDIGFLRKLKGLPIGWVDINNTLVNDLSPLADLEINGLNAHNIPATNYSTLAGRPLVSMSLGESRIGSLTPFRGMPLRELYLGGCVNLTDFTPLADLPLEKLSIARTEVSSLGMLRGVPLKSLDISRTKLSNLEGLENSKLEELLADSCHSLVSIAAVRGTQLRKVNFQWCENISDISALLECPALEEVAIYPIPGLEKLRGLPKLKRIGYEWDKMKPAADFWAEYDAKQKILDSKQMDLVQVKLALTSLGIIPPSLAVEEPWGVNLTLNRESISDARLLRPLPIDQLSLYQTKVTDLSPLRGMRLKELSIDETAIKDLSPLLDMPILEAAMIPQAAANIEVLRHHSTLKYLGWENDWDNGRNRPRLTTAEFWARYDALHPAAAK